MRASWDIHFENMSCAAIVSCGTPKLDGTKITDLQAVITKPGEGAGIFVDIVNGGTIDAKISSVEVSKLCTLNSSVEACDWDNDGSVTQKDIDKVNENVSLTIFYLLGPDNVIKPGDILKAGESRKMIVYFVYGKMENEVMIEGTELPSRDLKFNPVDIKINYVQA